jgi:hypothetical protein
MTANPGAALAGTFASSLDNANEVVYRRALEAITPGKAVVTGDTDADASCEQPDATGEISGGRVIGIALIDRSSTSTNYAAGDMVRIAVSGEVWVAAEDAVTVGAVPFVRFAVPGATGLGSFRSDADTANAIGLPNAKFSTSTAGAALAKVQLGVGAFI